MPRVGSWLTHVASAPKALAVSDFLGRRSATAEPLRVTKGSPECDHYIAIMSRYESCIQSCTGTRDQGRIS